MTRSNSVRRIRAARPGFEARRPRRERGPVRQQHVLVDLGLQLQLELRRRQLAPRPLHHVEEMAHSLDDLTELIEVRRPSTAARGRRSESSTSPSAPPIDDHQHLAIALIRSLDEVVHRGLSPIP